MSEYTTPLNVLELENNKKLIDTLMFLLSDNAFDKDFLITTIIEYIANNKELGLEKRGIGQEIIHNNCGKRIENCVCEHTRVSLNGIPDCPMNGLEQSEK
jgi:hypothetical protein